MSDRSTFEEEIRRRYGQQAPVLRELPNAREIVERQSTLTLIASRFGMES